MVEDTTLNDDPIKTNKLFAKYVHEKLRFESLLPVRCIRSNQLQVYR